MAPIELKWKCFETFQDLLIEKTHFGPEKNNPDHYWKPGVYLHTIKNTEYGELVDYVGKVDKDKLIERQITHYRNIKGGIYNCDGEVLKIFDDNYYEYVKDLKNKDYSPALKGNRKKGYDDPKVSDFSKILFREDISMHLSPIFFKYANSVSVYLAVMDKNDINLAEQILISDLKPIRNFRRYTQKQENFNMITFTGDVTEKKRDEMRESNKKFWIEKKRCKSNEK